ncbi:hypothetical protein SKAU_G00229900 [Synaphobranchus kaupii]|uniref:Ig-like domain-containing protein n=1 Tax=Synaphobranchus kaupii TaxID=118154 RepID=A0A9Q1F5G2_SYNKA|nr:hypothetical protein SKAU_G00229900 [Synaphobranchus kaupii]
MVILGLIQGQSTISHHPVTTTKPLFTVSPQISTRLDFRDGKKEAVCSATGGKPAASISWRNTWNSSVTQSSTKNLDGSFTVESRLILPHPISAANLSCIITHPSWRESHTEEIQFLNHGESAHFSLKKIVISLSCVIIALGILAVFCIFKKFHKKPQEVELHGLQTIYTIIKPSRKLQSSQGQTGEERNLKTV